jgi:hypothetical protein
VGDHGGARDGARRRQLLGRCARRCHPGGSGRRC